MGGHETFIRGMQGHYIDPGFGTKPSFLGITPPTGSFLGGTSVTINGTGLVDVTAVLFGILPALSLSVLGNNILTLTTPAGVGTVDVTLVTLNGLVVLKNGFTYT